jgi:hypothetical protein
MYLSFTIGLVLLGGVTVVRYMPLGFLLPSQIYLAGVFYFMNKKLYASLDAETGTMFPFQKTLHGLKDEKYYSCIGNIQR